MMKSKYNFIGGMVGGSPVTYILDNDWLLYIQVIAKNGLKYDW